MSRVMSVGGKLATGVRRIRSAVALVGLVLACAAQAAEAIDYAVSVIGVEDGNLRRSILNVSELLGNNKRPVPTLRALRRRVEASLPRISALLRARGYYDATQDFTVERKQGSSAAVAIRISLGTAYRIGRYDIHYTTPAEQHRPLNIPFSALGLKPGSVARSEVVAGSDARLLAALGRQGYPLARITDRRIVVDHKTRTLSVAVTVATGPFARFGPTRVDGLESVEEPLIQRNLAWVRGAPFNIDALEKTRSKLRQTGLFSSVLVRHVEKLDERGELAVTISVKERKHRSIGVGATYSTTEGPLGKLFWEDRNLLGQGEHLRVRAEAGQIRQGVFGDLRVADFGVQNQDLIADARVTKELPEGFTSIETAASIGLERRFGKSYAGSVGLGFDRSHVEQSGTNQNFTLLTVPLSARRDTSDDLLDPSRGGRDRLTFTPNFGILGTDSTFYVARLYDTVYVPLIPEKELVLAGWTRIGTIFGERTQNVPANKRLFAGGPGSVRGYALNSIGPLDAQNNPVGGRSSTEFGVELRWRAFDPIGLVAFVEGGSVYDRPMPEWGAKLQWGAGAGVRYLTKIGPLRLDVAVPLNRRNSIDDAFQILVSLGQAF